MNPVSVLSFSSSVTFQIQFIFQFSSISHSLFYLSVQFNNSGSVSSIRQFSYMFQIQLHLSVSVTSISVSSIFLFSSTFLFKFCLSVSVLSLCSALLLSFTSIFQFKFIFLFSVLSYSLKGNFQIQLYISVSIFQI